MTPGATIQIEFFLQQRLHAYEAERKRLDIYYSRLTPAQQDEYLTAVTVINDLLKVSGDIGQLALQIVTNDLTRIGIKQLADITSLAAAPPQTST